MEILTPANAPFINYVDNGNNNGIRGNVNNCYDERANNSYLANSFNQDRSYLWEKAIDFCNYLNKDFYINLPVLIDLNYARELSKLLKSSMKPSLNIHVDVSSLNDGLYLLEAIDTNGNRMVKKFEKK